MDRNAWQTERINRRLIWKEKIDRGMIGKGKADYRGQSPSYTASYMVRSKESYIES